MSKPPLGLLQRLRTLLQKNDSSVLTQIVEMAVPFDVAWCLNRFRVEDRVQVLSSVSPQRAVKIFNEIDLEQQVEILKLGRLPSLTKIVALMDSDDLADVLGKLEPTEKVAWLGTLPAQELHEAESLLAYPPDTAGGLMAKEYISVPEHLTAGEVAARLQSLASSYENLKTSYVYVINKEGILTGVLPMRDMILKPRETPITSFMVKTVATVPDVTPERDVAQTFRDLDLLALPVVNSQQKMVGVITSDDVIDVIQELAQEEMLKISGVSADETRESPLKKIIQKRLSWLSVNIFLNLTAASVIAFYEDTLSAVITLAFFFTHYFRHEWMFWNAGGCGQH